MFSLAALRLLGGLPSAVDPVRRYWVHLGMTFFLLLGIAASFWTFWSLSEVAWTFPRFLLVLAIPGLLYFCAAMLVPENPEAVASWKEHYYSGRHRLYLGFGLWGVVTAASATVNLSMPLAHPARLIQATAILIGVLGSASANPRVHAGIVFSLFAVWALVGLTSGSLPGWIAP